jgi:hypothetical protein
MKRYMLILAAICVGFTCTAARSLASPAAAKGHSAWMQGRGDDDDQGRGRGRDKDRHDRGRHEGQYKRFDDHHREQARDWYDHHRDDRAWRYRGEWRPEYESDLREGYVLSPDFRRSWCRPLPSGLRREFGPPPRGYRYFIIGPHVVLVDPGYRVADVIHFDINIGR